MSGSTRGISMTTIGMNLAGTSYYSAEWPWIDRVRAAGNWVADGGATLPVDQYGNPIAILPAGVNRFYFMVGLDMPALATTDDYVLTWEGNARINLAGAQVISSGPNRMVIRADTPSGQVQVSVDQINSANPPHDFHVVRADQVALFNAGEIFNPAFLAMADDWTVLRFMDWGKTNNNNVVTWDQRTTPQKASWSDSGSTGVPIEIMVQLSNRTGTDLWINIPAKADDNYIRQTLLYVRDHLDPTLKVHLEYSNETWNWQFAQTAYVQERGNQLWGTDANHDGWVNGQDARENNVNAYQMYYGYRAAQMAAIANDVFSGQNDSRLKVVLATQTAWQGLEDLIFRGVQAANVGSASSLFDEYAVTTYFGNSLSGLNAADMATVVQWARSGAAGLTSAFRELEIGGSLTSNSSLAWLRSVLVYQHNVAEKYGLSMVAYEGGLHAVALSYDASVRQDVVDFFLRLQTDDRMALLYQKMAADFGAAGGDMLVSYADVGKWNQYGSWGLIDDIYATSSRYDALAAINNDTTVDVRTELSSFILGNAQHNLTYTGQAAFAGTGNPSDNIIIGGNGGNTLQGKGGDDTLIGGSGADTLDGGTGVDRMTGGAGNDTYVVDDAGDIVIELPGGGIDEIRTTLASYTLPTIEVENLTAVGTGSFIGSGNATANVITGLTTAPNQLFGLAGDDTLVGGTADDLLDGGTGADRMTGGAGNDVYIVDDSGDVVVEVAYAGDDTVRTTLSSYTLPAEVERLTFIGSGAFTGTGNTLANIITGSATAPNVLDGGQGADTLIGGAANDVYIVDSLADTIVEQANGGTDEVRTTLVNYTLGINLENLSYMGIQAFIGTGNAAANVIRGGPSTDILDGGAGADTLIGGAGNDTYLVDNSGDVIIEDVNGGTDLVRVTASSYTLSANVENMTYVGGSISVTDGGARFGTGTFIGTGNVSDNYITGWANGPNRLSGGAGNDTLIGGSSTDILDGGAGADTMRGGPGNDVYYVDNVADIILESAGGGLDEVRSTANTFSLSTEVENLTFVGVGNFTGTGNASSNMITGGNGDDRLDGGNGDDLLVGGRGNDYLIGGFGRDVMIGGLGDDTYEVSESTDLVIESPGEGEDTVRSMISYTLGANVERLVLTHPGGLVGTGNSLNNVITSAMSGDSQLYGLGGNDILNGGTGHDTLDGGDGDDTLYGNNGNDRLIGGTGNDLLDGGVGADVLIGGDGKDILTGGAGADIFTFGPGDLASTIAATDRITDFNRAEMDKLDFTGFRLTTALSFLGTGVFTQHAGEIRYQAAGNQLDVMIDLNGDGIADIHLMVASASNDLIRNDFTF